MEMNILKMAALIVVLTYAGYKIYRHIAKDEDLFDVMLITFGVLFVMAIFSHCF